MKQLFLILITLLAYFPALSQRDNYWVFGDSAGMNFSTSPPSVDTTRIVMTEEPAATISDENGNLLFYAGTAHANQSLPGSRKYVVRNAIDSIMPGGDSIAGHTSITQGLLILPFPYDSSKYCIFHINWPGNYLYYSVVDMSLNNGLGEIIQSNLLLSDSVSEKMQAVKAANGRDWWLVTLQGYPVAKFYKYKIDSTGINIISSQNTPQIDDGWTGQLVFSRMGDKVLSVGPYGATYLFDFDRCEGVLSNPVLIDQYVNGFQTSLRYGGSFSPSGRFVYLSTFDSLFQFDTYASNIMASKQLIYFNAHPLTPFFDYSFGSHMLGPDGKIYISNGYIYPNQSPIDSMNTHLNVINNPDSFGIACDFLPYSFSLLGRKTYLSLPNMPNYNLGKLENINCDSILTADLNELNDFNIKIFPNPVSGKLFIDVPNSFKQSIEITIYSITGQMLLKSTYKDGIDFTSYDKGLYIVEVATERNRVFRKVVRE